MLSQALFAAEERSGTAGVIRVALYDAPLGRQVSLTNTGVYCRAHNQVAEGIVRRLW
jgi:hypothetical protein